MKKNLIIFEKNSIFIKFLLLFFNQNKTLIYYLHPYQIDQYIKFTKRIKSFEEFKLSHDIEQGITFEANKETLKLQKDFNYEIIKNLFKKLRIPQDILLAFKKYQLNKIAYQIRLAKLSNYLEKNCSSNFKIFYFLNNKFDYDYSKMFIKNQNTKINNFNIINLFKKLISFFMIIFFIPSYILYYILKFGLSLKAKKPKNYQYGFHVNNHIFDRNKFATEKKYLNSRNDYLLSKTLNYDDKESVYIFSFWNLDKEDKLRSLEEIKSRNAEIGYEFNHPLNLKVLGISIKYYYNSIIFFIFNFYKKKISFMDLTTIYQIIRDLLKCEIFCSKFKILNFISRDDFNPIHICRTIVFKKYGLKNNGIAHSICLENFTSVCGPYTYFNTYFTQGSFYFKNIYKKYWFSDFNKSIGPIYGRLVNQSLNNKIKKQHFFRSYGQNKKICYLIGSFNSNTCPFDNILDTDFLENFYKILKEDEDMLLFVVARRKEQIDYFIKKFNNYEIYKKRIIINNYFSTYDYMAYCDYLISDSTSSSLFEGTMNPNLSILPINNRKINENPLYNYKEIKIFENIYELKKFFATHNKLINKIAFNNQEIKKIL